MREIFFIGVVFSLLDELSFDRMSLRRKIEKERESILCWTHFANDWLRRS